MAGNGRAGDRDYRALQEEIARWEQRQIEAADELRRLRQRLQELARRRATDDEDRTPR